MGVDVDIPGFGAFQFQHVLFDLNGTLGEDGLITEVTRAQLIALGHTLTLHVMTADTHGTLDHVLAGLPLEAQRVQSVLGAEHTIGWATDVMMWRCCVPLLWESRCWARKGAP